MLGPVRKFSPLVVCAVPAEPVLGAGAVEPEEVRNEVLTQPVRPLTVTWAQEPLVDPVRVTVVPGRAPR